MNFTNRKIIIAATFFITLSSLINFSLFTSDFKISLAIILLPILAYLLPEAPLVPIACLSSIGVFGVRTLEHYFIYRTFQGTVGSNGPEILFYVGYGTLLWLYCRRHALFPFRLRLLFPIAFIDLVANLLEVSFHWEDLTITGPVALQLGLVALCRTGMAIFCIKVLDSYGLVILGKREATQYRQLLLMTASLKSDLAWLRKSSNAIENTMDNAYQLYNQLRKLPDMTPLAQTTLNIAKDIHDIKKEYLAIVRGMDLALNQQPAEKGMYFGDIWKALMTSLDNEGKKEGKTVSFLYKGDNFYTNKQDYLLSVFYNLMQNALEADTKKDTRISLTHGEKDGNRVFYFSDTSGGIPEDRIEHIFVPGFSSKINYETGEVNRGLGLAIVADIVENHLKGNIRVETDNRGTTFILTIPLDQLEGDEPYESLS